MCQECGCGQPGPTRIDGRPASQIPSPLLGEGHVHPHEHGHEHEHDHEHTHPHDHTHPPGQMPPAGQAHRHAHRHTHAHAHPHADDHGHEHVHPHPHDHEAEARPRHVEVHQAILAANDRQGERNRGFLRGLGVLALNVVSSPGSGKTELIRQTLERFRGRLRIGVIVGDLETDNDARRLRAAGAPVVQITTGTLCHLDAEMVARALATLDPQTLDILFIENVGNLVCPAAFDLGEELRVALLATTEGEDKPLKYPPLFHSAGVVLITKTDLAAATEFPRERALANIRQASPAAEVFEVSARSGEGLEAWCGFLERRLAALRRR